LPKSAGALGDFSDVRDLDVGQARKPVGPALDDAAGEPATPVERVVGAMLEMDDRTRRSVHHRVSQVQIPAVPRIHRPERSIRGPWRVTALEAPWTRRGHAIIS
jgi:hypothetical protein